MNTQERIDLIHALMVASNSFHETLKKHGYTVSYGLDNTKNGSILKLGTTAHNNWPLGVLTISWELKK